MITSFHFEQSPPQGGITIEGYREQLNGDSVRSDSLCVRQRADGICLACKCAVADTEGKKNARRVQQSEQEEMFRGAPRGPSAFLGVT